MMPQAKSFALFVLTIFWFSGPAEKPGTVRLVDSFQAVLADRLPVAESNRGMSQGGLQHLKSLGRIQ